VNVTMMDGKVKRMNYVGPTGGLLSPKRAMFLHRRELHVLNKWAT